MPYHTQTKKDKHMKDKCIIWQGYVQSGGYGQIYHKGKRILAHRKAWMDKHGYIPKGLFVCHKCDNPLCVNVDHLFLGTPKENMQDAISKGRMRLDLLAEATRKPRKRVLTREQCEEIVLSKEPLKTLSDMFGVSMACISMVRRGLRKNRFA
jgi:hypothetical protein